MIQLVETIDAIARRLNRDVVFLSIDMKKDPPYNQIIEWLNLNEIGHEHCLPFKPGWTIFEGQADDLFLEVPYDATSENIKKLDAYFEKEDRTSKFEGVQLCLLSLELARTNTPTDEDDFDAPI